METTMRFHFTSQQKGWPESKRPEITSLGENVQKREGVFPLVGMSIGAATVWNGVAFPHKVKTTSGSYSNCTLGII